MRSFLTLFLIFMPTIIFAQQPEFVSVEPDDFLKSLVYVEVTSLVEVDSPFGKAITTMSGHGSGVVVKKTNQVHPKYDYLVKGYVLTAQHVVEFGDKKGVIKCRYQNGCGYKSFRVIETDPDSDLAIIEGYIHKDCKEIEFEGSLPVRNQLVRIMGYPFDCPLEKPKYLKAPVARTSKDGAKILIDEDTQPGFSGGPVITEKGKLVGIVSGGSIWCQEKGKRPFTWPIRVNSVSPIARILAKAEIMKGLLQESATNSK